ncbi:hypothetical protein Tco_1283239 [Tanacetum coccineum]
MGSLLDTVKLQMRRMGVRVITTLTKVRKNAACAILNYSTLVAETEKPSKDLQVKVAAADAVATKDNLLTSPDPVENIDSQVIVNDDLKPTTSALINEAECQVTVVEPSEEVQVKAHVSELA